MKILIEAAVIIDPTSIHKYSLACLKISFFLPISTSLHIQLVCRAITIPKPYAERNHSNNYILQSAKNHPFYIISWYAIIYTDFPEPFYTNWHGIAREIFMRVLHLIGGGDVGGAKTHVLSLVNKLGDHIDVKMISLRPGVFSEDAQAMGIDVEVVKSGNIFADIRRVLKIAKDGKYDILHSHGAKANMFAVIIKFLTGIPTVTTVHSDYRLDYLNNVYKKYSFGVINTIALRFIDYHIGVSKRFKEMLVKRNFNPENIFTVYNGIDYNVPVKSYSREEFAIKYHLDIGENDVLVGILARLDPVKDVSTFLKAAAEVVKVNPSVKFIIGGDGDERKALEQQAEALGITNNALFPGWINDSDEFMSCIDINVLTSLSESFPYTILEGVRLKRATVTSDVGGLSDLIDNGENGYLFNPGDYKTLAEYILELAKNKDKRLEMGEKIYKKAYSQFSLDSMCRTQLEIYESILKKSRDRYLYDIVLSGYYGFRNSGDDAILSAIIDNIRRCRKDVRIVALSKNPPETRQIFNVDSINRINLFKILRVLRKSKLFINGGGNLMQDGTSTRSIVYYLGTTWLAKKMGLKVMVYANGIGPINKKINRKFTRKVLNQVDVITLRERLSISELNNLDIYKPRIVVTADPALTVEPVGDGVVDRIFSQEGISCEQPLVGISVRRCENHIKFNEDTIAEAADYLIEKYGARPVFIPMQHPKDMDIIKSIMSKMSGKAYVLKGEYDAPNILGVIGRMEMLIGMRLHSLIYAASLGIPVVGLVYDPKVEGFLQYFHQSSAGHVSDLSFERLKQVIDEVWNNREKIRQQLIDVTADLKKKAFENAEIAISLIENAL